MSFKKKPRFLESEESARVYQELKAMQEDSRYNTQPSFIPVSEDYPMGQISFTAKNMDYINKHYPEIDPMMYIANLKLKTRI